MLVNRLLGNRIIAMAFAAGCHSLAAEARASDVRMLRLHPCDGVAAFAKEFRLPRGTTLTGIRLNTEPTTSRFPEIVLVAGPALVGARAHLRRIENAPSVSGVVTATWDDFSTTEDVYHVIVRLPRETALVRAPRLRALEADAAGGTFVVGEHDELLMAVLANLDLHLLTRTNKAASDRPEERMEGTQAAIEALAVRFSKRLTSQTVELTLRSGAFVEIAVYDVGGHLIRTLTESFLPRGRHEFPWDGMSERGSIAARGMYIVTARAAGGQVVRKSVIW